MLFYMNMVHMSIVHNVPHVPYVSYQHIQQKYNIDHRFSAQVTLKSYLLLAQMETSLQSGAECETKNAL